MSFTILDLLSIFSVKRFCGMTTNIQHLTNVFNSLIPKHQPNQKKIPLARNWNYRLLRTIMWGSRYTLELVNSLTVVNLALVLVIPLFPIILFLPPTMTIIHLSGIASTLMLRITMRECGISTDSRILPASQQKYNPWFLNISINNMFVKLIMETNADIESQREWQKI